MYTLLKESYGDYDILQTQVIAISANLATLETKAAELNAQRSKKFYKHGEWDHTYRADPKKVAVF